MSSYNKIIMMGNLTRDPELRYTPSQTAVCDFGLAVNERFKNKAGEITEHVCFIDVTAWGNQAENVAKYLKKGDPALIDGSLQFEMWEKDGQKRSKHTIRANFVTFIPKSSGRPQPTDEDAPASDPENIQF